MTAPTSLSNENAVSYSVRTCPKCSAALTRAGTRFGRPLWECPSCGKRTR
jgi:ribosomal protein L37AE/L43A